MDPHLCIHHVRRYRPRSAPQERQEGQEGQEEAYDRGGDDGEGGQGGEEGAQGRKEGCEAIPRGLLLATTDESHQKKEAAAASTSTSTAPESATPVPAATPSIDSALASQADSDAFLATHAITLKPTPYRLLLNFATLPIKEAFRPYLKSYTQPTPIQAASWPKLFAGDDVIGIAETGSGKTLTFGLPGLQLLTTLPTSIPAVKGKGKGNTNPIQLLVLAPTRELALQTYDTVSALGKHVGIDAVCLFGGMSRDEQVRQVRQKDVRVVVGTPGRILDLANSGDVDFSKYVPGFPLGFPFPPGMLTRTGKSVKYLVLDEADRMLDQGFENDIRQIIGFCPSKEQGRQTLMCMSLSSSSPDLR